MGAWVWKDQSSLTLHKSISSSCTGFAQVTFSLFSSSPQCLGQACKHGQKQQPCDRQDFPSGRSRQPAKWFLSPLLESHWGFRGNLVSPLLWPPSLNACCKWAGRGEWGRAAACWAPGCKLFSKFWVRLWWRAAEVDPEVAVTPAVSVPKPSSSKGNWKGMVTGTRPPSIPKGVTVWFVTDKGDVMRVRGEALANNDAPAVDCTLAVTTEDPEAEVGLCGVDNGLVAPCVPLPVPKDPPTPSCLWA